MVWLVDVYGVFINWLVNCGDIMVVFGDDEGCIKVWDMWYNKCCNIFEVYEDFVVDMEFLLGSN